MVQRGFNLQIGKGDDPYQDVMGSTVCPDNYMRRATKCWSECSGLRATEARSRDGDVRSCGCAGRARSRRAAAPVEMIE